MWLLCLVFVSRALECIVMYSSKTKNSQLNEFSEFRLTANLSSLTFEEITNQFPASGNWIFIDITLSSSFYNILDSLAEYYNTIYLSIIVPDVSLYSKWRKSVHNSYESEALALTQSISLLNITNIAVLSSNLIENIKISSMIRPQLPKISVEYIKYEEEISQAVSDLLIGRMIKAKGINKLVILGNENSVMNIQKSLISKNMPKSGSIYIFTTKSIFSVFINGSLIITEEGLESAQSAENYEFLSIKNALKKLRYDEISDSSILVASNSNSFKEELPYSIVNIQKGQRVILGTINKKFSSIAPIIFPGNISMIINLKKTTLNLWIDNGVQEVNNLYYYELFNYFYSGAIYAVARSNILNDIPNFSLNLTQVSCGIFFYDPVSYYNCIEPKIYELPIAYLTSYWHTAALGNLLTLRALDQDIPHISPFSQDEVLNNNTQFPEFLKLSSSMQKYLTNAFLFSRALGWNDVVLLATDDPIFSGQYKSVVMFLDYLGMKIVNPEDKRILPQNYTRVDFEKYKSYFQAAKDTHCRIYILLIWEREHVWEGLYDIGLRRGDFYTITETAALRYLTEVDNFNLYKRLELMVGSLVITYRQFIGDLGQQLEKEMSLLFPSLSYMGMTYDTVSTVKEAIKYLLIKGGDYEDVSALKHAMRHNKFTGCLGNVFFAKDENSIANTQFIMQQISYNHNKTELILVDIAYLDTLSARFITMINSLEWPDGSTSIPTNYRLISRCPFDSYQIKNSYLPKMVIYVVSSSFFFISLISAYLSQKNFKNSYQELNIKAIISFSDFAFMAYFFFQFLQFLSLGSDQNSFKSLVENIQILFSLEFSLYFKVEFERFWVLFSTILAFAVVWIFLCVMIALRCEVSHRNNYICEKFKYLSELMLPFLGHVCFLPIFSMLMNILMCNKSIGEHLTDSYLDQDCTTFCFTGKHKSFTIGTLVVIALYLSAAIYTRPIWELTQTSLHIRTKPIYLSVLSIFQVLLVILNKTLRIYSQVAHGYTLCVLIAAFTAYTIITKPYNYKKAYILQIASLVMSFWGILTASIFINEDILTVWVSIEFVGFLVILFITGILFTKSPILLYSKKGPDISTLFIFQFCKNYERYIKDPGSLHFSKSQTYKFSDQVILNHSRQELD